MIPAPLNRLHDVCHVLIGALDADDIDAIETALGDFRAAVDGVRAVGGWRDLREVAECAATIAGLVEAARLRVNFLTDINRQRIERLSAIRGYVAGGGYRRNGAASL